MGDFSIIGGAPEALSGGFDQSTTTGTTVTSDGSTANVIGPYTELISSVENDYESDEITVYMFNEATAPSDASFLTSIAIGASNHIITPTMMTWSPGSNASLDCVYKYTFPITTPGGVIISAVTQCSVTGGALKVSVVRRKKVLSVSSPLSLVTSYGETLSASRGTLIARSTANVFGPWTEIVAELPETIKGFVVVGIRASGTGGSWDNGNMTFQVGVGEAGTSGDEQIIYSGHVMRTISFEYMNEPITPFVGVGISAGSRVVIRSKAEANNTDFDLDFIFYGGS